MQASGKKNRCRHHYIYIFWLLSSAGIAINFTNIVVINIPAVIVHAAHTHGEPGCLFRLSYL